MNKIKYLWCLLVMMMVHESIAQEEYTPPGNHKEMLRELDSRLKPNANYFDIVREAELFFEETNADGGSRKEGKAYKKYLRWRDFWANRIDENGGFGEPLKQGVKYGMDQRKNQGLLKAGSPQWEPMGPWETPLGGTGAKGVGQVTSAQFHPDYNGTTNKTLFAASSAGGLFKTTDGGDNWECISDTYTGALFYGGRHVLIDPNDADKIYMSSSAGGAMSIALSKSRDMSLGVLYTDDGGTTWTNLNDANAVLTNGNDADVRFELDPLNGVKGREIAHIKLHPTNGKLYMLVRENLTAFRPLTHPNDYAKSILYVGEDPGTGWEWEHLGTWSATGVDVDLRMMHFIPDGTDYDLYLAGDDEIIAFDLATNTGTSLYNELFNDLTGDNDWDNWVATNPKHEYACEYTPDDPDYIYFLCRQGYDAAVVKYHIANNDFTWFATMPNSVSFTASGGRTLINIAPDDKERIYISKVSVYRWDPDPQDPRFRSIRSNNTTNTEYMHDDVMEIEFWDGDSDVMLVANDGGVSFSTQQGLDDLLNPEVGRWTDINGCGLQIARGYSIDGYEDDPNILVIGLHDNAIARRDANGDWNSFDYCDGGGSSIRPDDPNKFVWSCNSRVTLDGNQLKVYSYSQERSFLPGSPNMFITGGRKTSGSNFEGLWYYDLDVYNSGWQEYSADFGKIPVAMSICETNPDVCFLSHVPWWFSGIFPDHNVTGEYDDGTPFTYTYASELKIRRGNNGQSNDINDWEDIAGDLGSELGDFHSITSIVTHPLDENRAWLSCGLFENQKKVFYVDYDQAQGSNQDWVNWSQGLPNFPVNDLLFDRNSGYIFAATDVGVYYRDSEDPVTGGTGWQEYGTGLPTTMVTEMVINRQTNKLRVITFGRGVWEVQLECSKNTINLPQNFEGFYKEDEIYGAVSKDGNESSELVAHTKIKLTPGFDSNVGASGKRFIARIVNCGKIGDGYPCVKSLTPNASNAKPVIEAGEAVLSVTPNPTDGRFNVHVLKDGMLDQQYTIDITDITGKLVSTMRGTYNQNNNIDISTYPNGIYFVRVSTPDEVLTERVVKQ